MRALLLALLLILPVRADGLSLRLQVYDPGEGRPLRFILKVENLTGRPVELSQPSSQTHEFEVTRKGVQVWRWSADKMFMQMIADRVFQPGETVTYTGEWDRKDVTGKAVPPGSLTLKAWLPVVQGEPPSVTREIKL
jgi:hypothetical protein